MTTSDTHFLLPILGSADSIEVRISFVDGGVFHLRKIYPIDTSIYGHSGEWSGEIVEVSHASISPNSPHRPGAYIDFNEAEVQEIVDLASAEVLYSRPRGQG